MKKNIIIFSVIIFAALSSTIYIVYHNKNKTLNKEPSYNFIKKNSSNSNFETTIAQKPVTAIVSNPSSFGNTPSNIMNGGLFLNLGNELYYSLNDSASITGRLIHSLADGVTNSSVMNKSYTSDLNLVGNYIYYTIDKQGIFKCKADGSENSKVLSGDISNLIIYENYMYYIDSNKSLVRCSINNLEDFHVFADYAYNFTLSEDGNFLFYSCDENGIYYIKKISLQNNSTSILVNGGSALTGTLMCYKNYLYFSNANSSNSSIYFDIYKIDFSSNHPKAQSYLSNLPFYGNPVNINNGYMYYLMRTNENYRTLYIKNLISDSIESIIIDDYNPLDISSDTGNLYVFDKKAYFISGSAYVYIFDLENKTYKKLYTDIDNINYYLD